MLDKKAEGKKPVALKILIDSNLPKDPDMAWGAALTVSTMVAVAKSQDLLDQFPPKYMASLNLNAMKVSGFGGRQMDQTTSILSRQGHALKIDFSPYLHTKAYKLPQSVDFVIHNALPPTK